MNDQLRDAKSARVAETAEPVVDHSLAWNNHDAPLSRAEALGPNAKFDGTVLCDSLRDEVERLHRQLRDPAARKTFDNKWSTVCKSDPRTHTEAGADQIGRDMIASLGERFDRYFDKAGTAAVKREANGTEIGLGIQTEIRNVNALRTPQPYEAQISKAHPLEIIDITSGSPAAQAGLHLGDQITEVNGITTNGLKRRDILAKLEGDTEANVNLKVMRPTGHGKAKEIAISAREKYINEEIASYRNLGDGIGYVRIKNLMADKVATQAFNAIGKSGNLGDKALVIDLRNNHGGSVTRMEEIAEQILSKGSIYRIEQRSGDVLLTETRRITDHELTIESLKNGDTTTVHHARLGERIVAEDKPIVVLIDSYSASAAEILAGLLKANKRATLVGMPTTGKSEGQQPIELPFGRSANLTTFEFFPGEQPVPHTGLQPDVLVERNTDFTRDNQLDTAKSIALKLAKQSAHQPHKAG